MASNDRPHVRRHYQFGERQGEPLDCQQTGGSEKQLCRARGIARPDLTYGFFYKHSLFWGFQRNTISKYALGCPKTFLILSVFFSITYPRFHISNVSLKCCLDQSPSFTWFMTRFKPYNCVGNGFYLIM